MGARRKSDEQEEKDIVFDVCYYSTRGDDERNRGSRTDKKQHYTTVSFYCPTRCDEWKQSHKLMSMPIQATEELLLYDYHNHYIHQTMTIYYHESSGTIITT